MTGPARSPIDDLVADLTPIRRFPALRVAMLGVVVVSLLITLIVAAVHQPRVDLAARLTNDPWFVAVVVGLILGAYGASLAGFAGVVPGRDAVERPARLTAAVGLSVAVLAGAAAMLLGREPGLTPVGEDAACFVLGTAVASIPALAIVMMQRFGHVRRPGPSAVVALVGAFGLGALAVQLVCHHAGARHMLFGHVGIPVVMLIVGFVPLSLLLRRLAESQSR